MFESRIKSLQGGLSEHEIDALLITSTHNIAYLSGVFAFSIEEREARILITKQNCYLFTDARYTELVRQKAPFTTLCEVNSNNPLVKQLLEITKRENIETLGFEEENISYKEVSDFEEKLVSLDFVPTQDIIEDSRTVKDTSEIEKIKKACHLTDLSFEFILKHLKPGVTELEIKAKLENFIRLEGGSLSFESIVAFGQNCAIPHHLSNNTKLKTENIILLDFGAKVDGYCSDMTRTVFLGKPSQQLKKMYIANLEAQELALDYLKTHMDEMFLTKQAQELANSHLRKLGFSEIPQALGHGVGLQVHENPTVSIYSEGRLTPGNIITIEPGIYVNGLGGIRIEDTILITMEGIEVLTRSKKDLIILNS